MTNTTTETVAETGSAGRVCPYSRQTCALSRGCSTWGDKVLPWDALAVELAAVNCRDAGSPLYAAEVISGKISADHADLVKRTALRDRRRRQLDDAIAARERARAAAIASTRDKSVAKAKA